HCFDSAPSLGLPKRSSGLSAHAHRSGQRFVDVQSFFQEVPVPQFKDEQTPEAGRVIPAFLKMLVKHPPNAIRVEVSSLQRLRIQQRREYEIFQLAAHPMPER